MQPVEMLQLSSSFPYLLSTLTLP